VSAGRALRGRYASYPSLEDRVVFVTGGGSGIGASIVEHLCAQRARVTFVDIQREVSEALVARVAARGLPTPSFIACDLSRRCARRWPRPRRGSVRSGSW
jgi:NAD(P)-dependent dehydrogenase (short-subunit alcohol dehydrogenase family)